MSTETFESIITHIPAPIETVYATLSDLNNVSRLRDAIPQDRAQQIKEMRFDADSCTISVDPVGELTFRVVMREPNKTIKFTAENSPIPLFLWIQLVAIDEQNTTTSFTVRTDVNPFLKKMIAKPLKEGIDRMAQALAMIPYNKL